MSIPSTVVYFGLYDELVNRMKIHTPYAPVFAGITARTFTTTLVSPLELLRTKQQYSGENIW
jgi:solute carrier family 25 protein 39/40